jgi:hypothetical protein
LPWDDGVRLLCDLMKWDGLSVQAAASASTEISESHWQWIGTRPKCEKCMMKPDQGGYD